MLDFCESNLTFSKEWLCSTRLSILKHNLPCIEPLQNTSDLNEQVFEWWYKNRKLIIYIDNKIIEFVQVWGTDIDTQMKDGLVKSPNNIENLYVWLINSNY
jgi:hypothetical protein